MKSRAVPGVEEGILAPDSGPKALREREKESLAPVCSGGVPPQRVHPHAGVPPSCLRASL